jgi:hypothetical protein
MDQAKLREGLRKAGLYIAEGDPVLELAICELALTDTVRVIERITKAQADRVIAASAQSVVDAEQRAAWLINKGGVWAEDRIKEAGQEAANLVLFELRQETAKAERASRIAIRAAWVAAAVAGLAFCFLVGILLAMLQHH